MMNEARIGVGMQGLALSEVAYQNAAAYARERRQGRALSAPRRRQAADPIIVHPDVRRTLLHQRLQHRRPRAGALDRAWASPIAPLTRRVARRPTIGSACSRRW